MKCYNHPEVEAIGTCTSCGKAICSDCSMEVGGKLVCKPCTEKMAAQCVSPQAASRKEPALALLLSLIGGLVSGLLIGLGQVYNGQVKKGIILSVAHIFIWIIIIAAYIASAISTAGIGFIGLVVCLPMFCVPAIMSPVLWFYAMYDAYMTADKLNKGIPAKDWLD